MSRKLSRRRFIMGGVAGVATVKTAFSGMALTNKEKNKMAPDLLESLKEEREALMKRLYAWAGEMPERGDLHSKELYRREYNEFSEIKLTYTGEKGEIIPAYLLIPRNPIRKPIPAIYAAHQCGYFCDIGKEQVVGKRVDLPNQAYGFELAQRGFAILAPDANKVGERFDPELKEQWKRAKNRDDQNTCCCSKKGFWGKPRWKPVFDVMRGIDLLNARDELDADRLGMIGFSLGSDTTLWAMPFDQRIKVAAVCPGGIIKEQGTQGWDPYGLPYEDLLKMIAPRPFFEATGTSDPINYIDEPYKANERIDKKMEKKRQIHSNIYKLYQALGMEDAIGMAEFDGGHDFPREMRLKCYEWFEKWML